MDAFECGRLIISQRQGLINLIPKKGKDPLFLKNWRPLSLLNQDYKLIAKCIAARIKHTLCSIIHHDQSGFIKDRYIGENIIRILDLLDYTEKENIPSLLMVIDFEKAFDFLEWDFIDRSLKHFNFGESLRKWVTLLYSNISSCVLNNGWASEHFNLSRGVRQGCPLSPYLFIIAAEILALNIRQNRDIKGININGKESKISQYADDTSLTLSFDENTIITVQQTFDLFHSASGLKVNYDKTEILRIGSLKNSNARLINCKKVKWTNGPITLLGIHICMNKVDLLASNYEPIVKKIVNICQIWGQRNLTLFGKVTIIKTLLVSNLVYRLSVLPSPKQDMLDSIQNILFDFLWHYRKHKIKKDILYNTKENGGIDMVHIVTQNKALKASWVKRLISDDDAFWKQYILSMLPKMDNLIFFECNLSKMDLDIVVPNLHNSFWREILECWCEFNYLDHENPNAEQCTLWYNSNIRIANKPVFYKKYSELGMNYYKDLLDTNGKIYNFDTLSHKYGLHGNVLHYHSLVAAIPLHWKGKKKTLEKTVSPNFDKLKCKTFKSRTIYTALIKAVSSFPENTVAKWNEYLGLDLDNEAWQSIFQNLYTTSMSAQLRALQYKILHRTLATNRMLHIWNIIDHELCSFCMTETETLTHLFYHCNFTKNFWAKVKSYAYDEFHIDLEFSIKDVLFGNYDDNTEGKYYDMMIIAGKWTIFQCKVACCNPSIEYFIKKLNEFKGIELKLAEQNNNLFQYYLKWGPLA